MELQGKELVKEKNKKRYELKKKVDDLDNFKSFKKICKKSKKINYKKVDYDSEQWYE